QNTTRGPKRARVRAEQLQEASPRRVGPRPSLVGAMVPGLAWIRRRPTGHRARGRTAHVARERRLAVSRATGSAGGSPTAVTWLPNRDAIKDGAVPPERRSARTTAPARTSQRPGRTVGRRQRWRSGCRNRPARRGIYPSVRSASPATATALPPPAAPPHPTGEGTPRSRTPADPRTSSAPAPR